MSLKNDTNLLAEDEVFEKGGPTFSNAQTLLVRDWATNIAGHVDVPVVDFILGHELVGGSGVVSSNGRVTARKALGIAFHVRTSECICNSECCSNRCQNLSGDHFGS